MTYSYLHLLAPDTTELLRLLNAHGAQGWRLRSCEFCADPQGERKRWAVLMERVIPEPAETPFNSVGGYGQFGPATPALATGASHD